MMGVVVKAYYAFVFQYFSNCILRAISYFVHYNSP